MTTPARPHNSADGSPPCLHGVECFTAAWLLGLLAAFVYASNPLYPALLAGIALIGMAGLWLYHDKASHYPILWVVGLLLASGDAALTRAFVIEPQYQLDGQQQICTATVLDMQPLTGDRMRYTLRTKPLGISTEVDWYADSDIPLLHIGDTITLDAKFARLTDSYHAKTATYHAANGIYLRIAQAELLAVQPTEGFSLMRVLWEYRAAMTERIQRTLPQSQASLLTAMLFGEKRTLSTDTADALYQTGIGHIMAVSGLHLVFFCTLLLALLRKLGVPRIAQFCLCCAASLLFGLMVHSAVSVWRAALMLLLTLSAPLFGRHANTLRSLCLAAIVCTVATPYIIGSASFWLSISGVAGAGIFAPWMTKHIRLPEGSILCAPARVGRNLLELLCISIAVFPASVLFCGESSLIAPLGNLLVLPLCIIALSIGLLMVCTGGLTAFLLPAAGFLCDIATQIAQRMAALPYSHLQTTSHAVQITLLCCTAFVLLVTCTIQIRRHTALAILICTVLLSVQLAVERLSAHAQLRIALLGDANDMTVVLVSGSSTVVMDLQGNAKSARNVKQYLTDNHIGTVDLLFCRDTSAAGYQAALDAVAEVYLTTPTYFRADMQICGCTPVDASQQIPELLLADAHIQLTDDTLHIHWQNMHLAILSATMNAPVTADVVVRYGDSSIVPDDQCSVRLLTAEADCPNQQLVLSHDGKYKITALG